VNVTNDNPAGRLYLLLEKAKSLRGNGFAMWEQVFAIDSQLAEEKRQFEVVVRLFQTQELVDDVERCLLASGDVDPEPYIAALPEIRKALNFKSLDTGNYEVILSNIHDHGLRLLGLASEILSRRHSETQITEDELSEILSQVRALFEKVKATSFESDPDVSRLQTFILDSLTYIDDAIQQFRIRGVKRLEDALVRIAGEMSYRYGNIPEQASKHETTRNWFDEWKGVIGRLDSLIRFADTGIRAIDTSSRILALLTPG
jgi:hypothetical protein